MNDTSTKEDVVAALIDKFQDAAHKELVGEFLDPGIEMWDEQGEIAMRFYLVERLTRFLDPVLLGKGETIEPELIRRWGGNPLAMINLMGFDDFGYFYHGVVSARKALGLHRPEHSAGLSRATVADLEAMMGVDREADFRAVLTQLRQAKDVTEELVIRALKHIMVEMRSSHMAQGGFAFGESDDDYADDDDPEGGVSGAGA